MDLEEPIVEPVRKKTFSLMRDEEEERRAYGADTIRKGGGTATDRSPDGEELVSDRYLASLGAEQNNTDPAVPRPRGTPPCW